MLDAGIDFIDTAYDYVDAERRIGEFLGSRYGEFTLATKCGCTDTLPTMNASSHVWTRDNLFRGLEGSLARLRRDSVDVMQLHNPTTAECEAGGLVDALQEMRRNGHVRFIGVSTTLPDLPTYLRWGVFDVMQIPYSALEREHEEWITRAGEAGVGIVIRGGVAQGEPGSGRGSVDRWATFERAGLDELRDAGESRSAFVLRYTLTHRHAHTIIAGTTRPEHLQENVAAVLRGPLPEDTYAEPPGASTAPASVRRRPCSGAPGGSAIGRTTVPTCWRSRPTSPSRTTNSTSASSRQAVRVGRT